MCPYFLAVVSDATLESFSTEDYVVAIAAPYGYGLPIRMHAAKGVWQILRVGHVPR